MYFRLKPCHFSHLRVTMSLFLCAPQLYTIMENENQPSLTDQIRKLLEGVPDDKLNSVLDSLILERKEEKAKREKSRAIEKLVTAFLEDEDVKRFYVQAKPEAQDKFLQEYVDEIKRQCAEVDYSLHSLSNHIHENNPSPSDSGNNRKGSQGSEVTQASSGSPDKGGLGSLVVEPPSCESYSRESLDGMDDHPSEPVPDSMAPLFSNLQDVCI